MFALLINNSSKLHVWPKIWILSAQAPGKKRLSLQQRQYLSWKCGFVQSVFKAISFLKQSGKALVKLVTYRGAKWPVPSNSAELYDSRLHYISTFFVMSQIPAPYFNRVPNIMTPPSQPTVAIYTCVTLTKGGHSTVEIIRLTMFNRLRTITFENNNL